jgi:LPPG:FO 2-phospho-L-lactate transferase
MADACLTALGVATDAGAVAAHYGAHREGGILDAWLVAPVDGESELPPGVVGQARPLLMSDIDASAAIAGAAVEMALDLGSGRPQSVTG